MAKVKLGGGKLFPLDMTLEWPYACSIISPSSISNFVQLPNNTWPWRCICDSYTYILVWFDWKMVESCECTGYSQEYYEASNLTWYPLWVESVHHAPSFFRWDRSITTTKPRKPSGSSTRYSFIILFQSHHYIATLRLVHAQQFSNLCALVGQ